MPKTYNIHARKAEALLARPALLCEALAAYLLTFGPEFHMQSTVYESAWYDKYSELFVASGHFLAVLKTGGWLGVDDHPRDILFVRLTPKALAFIRGDEDEQN